MRRSLRIIAAATLALAICRAGGWRAEEEAGFHEDGACGNVSDREHCQERLRSDAGARTHAAHVAPPGAALADAGRDRGLRGNRPQVAHERVRRQRPLERRQPGLRRQHFLRRQAGARQRDGDAALAGEGVPVEFARARRPDAPAQDLGGGAKDDQGRRRHAKRTGRALRASARRHRTRQGQHPDRRGGTDGGR